MLDGDGLACSAIRSGVGLCIVPFPDEGLEVELRCGETNPPRGWVSFAYGHKEPAPVLIAMGCPPEISRASVRFSLSIENTVEQIDFAVERIAAAVARLRNAGNMAR